jgi:uncharacterized lipoprotein YmbA
MLLTFGLITGCSGVLESGKPSRQVYMLHSPSAAPGGSADEPAGSLVLSVHVVPGLDTDQVQVLGTDARLLPAANARWADNLPEVFTSITRRYLSDTRQFKAVHVGSIARPDEWLVELELQAFYGIQGGSGATTGVELKLEVMLRCNGQQHIQQIEKQTGVSGDTLASLVAAHQQALDAAMQELPGLIVQACRN